MVKEQNKEINQFLKKSYEYGFETDIESETLPPGINEDVIRIISKKKNEPEFLLNWRLKAFAYWKNLEAPEWSQLNIDPNIKTELKISVSGVEEHNDLLNVEKIIETNALVYAYSIGSISSDTVTYVLSIRGQVSDLEKLMNVNPLLTNQPSQRNGIALEYLYQAER
jgi:hypothetical protein